MAKKDIVVIGGSMGSGGVLRRMLRGLPADLPASVFITSHVPARTPSHLPDMLSADCALPVSRAVHGQPIEPGHVYVAPEDRHLLLLDSVVHLGAGPRENMVRPAIDPMFRSAALTYGARTVGLVLSGLMSDGASGLFAVKQRGGTTVVQHPLDAEAEDMPRAAIEAVQPDYVTRADELADLIGDLVRQDAGPDAPGSADLAFEVEVAAGVALGSDALRPFATPVPLTCPDCDGVLSEVKDGRPLRFRCQIGHAYTAEILAAETGKVDEAIRVAMRIMEERVELVERMGRDARQTGRTAVAELYEERGAEYRRYARTLREAALLTHRMNRPDADEPV